MSGKTPGIETTGRPNQESILELVSRRKSLLTTKELAGLLGLAETTLFQWTKAGRIPSCKFGSAIRFDPSDIAAWLRLHYLAA